MKSKTEREARAAMKKHRLRPIKEPLGLDGHTDAKFTQSDRELGELSYWAGDLFTDKRNYPPDTPVRDTYWHNEMTSFDLWMRIARAIRVHGLKIVDAEPEVRKAIKRTKKSWKI